MSIYVSSDHVLKMLLLLSENKNAYTQEILQKKASLYVM
jgi:hypothetical protein